MVKETWSSLFRALCLLMVIMMLSVNYVSAAGFEDMEIDGVSEDDYLKELEKIDEEYSVLEVELADTLSEVSELKIKIRKNESQVKKLEGDIVELEEELKDTMEMLSGRLRHQQRQQGLDSFIVMLASDSLTEVLQKNRVLRMVAKHDKDLMDRIKKDKAEISKKKLEMTTRQVEMEKKSLELEEKERILKGKKEELEKLREDKEAELEEHKSKILEEMRRQEEELERLAKEQAEAEEQARLKAEAQSTGSIDSSESYSDIVVGESKGVFMYPFDSVYRVSSPFGTRVHPIKKVKKFHSGVDFAAPAGTKVRSIGDGVVIWSGTRGGYGKTVMVNHGNGVISLYAHNSELLVNVGDEVSKGQLICRVGSTGMSTGPHLHLEVRKNGKATNPFEWMK